MQQHWTSCIAAKKQEDAISKCNVLVQQKKFKNLLKLFTSLGGPGKSDDSVQIIPSASPMRTALVGSRLDK